MCLLTQKILVSKESLKLFFCWVPFQIYTLVELIRNHPLDNGYFFSFLLNFFIFPFVFYVLFDEKIRQIDLEKLERGILKSVLLLSGFGIASFTTKLFFDFFLEIPGITINFSDAGIVQEEKFIDRGGVFKLISTYGNGNLFGICLLFFLPLYLAKEKSFIKRFIVKTALILTLSRTIWVGLILVECLTIFKKRKAKAFIFGMLSLLQIFIANHLMMNVQETKEFLNDSSFGGRDTQLKAFFQMPIFGTGGFDGIYEMVYLGIIENFGLIGLILFLFAAFFPILKLKQKSSFQRHLSHGIMLYGFICLSDGAILLIPVMFFYFFISSLIVKNLTKESKTTDNLVC